MNEATTTLTRAGSHMGKIERGQHLPSLALILKLAVALFTTPGDLVDQVASRLSKQDRAKE